MQGINSRFGLFIDGRPIVLVLEWFERSGGVLENWAAFARVKSILSDGIRERRKFNGKGL